MGLLDEFPEILTSEDEQEIKFHVVSRELKVPVQRGVSYRHWGIMLTFPPKKLIGIKTCNAFSSEN
jgi:hypothetical protein